MRVPLRRTGSSNDEIRLDVVFALGFCRRSDVGVRKAGFEADGDHFWLSVAQSWVSVDSDVLSNVKVVAVECQGALVGDESFGKKKGNCAWCTGAGRLFQLELESSLPLGQSQYAWLNVKQRVVESSGLDRRLLFLCLFCADQASDGESKEQVERCKFHLAIMFSSWVLFILTEKALGRKSGKWGKSRQIRKDFFHSSLHSFIESNKIPTLIDIR